MSLESIFPEDWTIERISDHLFFQEGPGVRKYQYRSKGVKLLNGSNINNQELNLDNTDRYIEEEEAYGKYKHFLVDNGDLLIACSGITVDRFDGKISFAEKKHLPLCMNTSTMRFKSINPNILDINYFKVFLTTNFFKKQLQQLITGSAQLNFGPSHVRQMDFPLPPLSTQKKIVDILDRAQRLIDLRKEQIKEMDTLVQALFYDMFGDPVVNPKGWEVRKLGELIHFLTSGSRGWAKYHSTSGAYFLKIQNVKHSELLFETVQYVKAPNTKEAERTKVREGDLLISITADLGRTAVVPKEIADHGAYINQHLALVRLESDVIEPIYVSFHLESEGGKRQFLSLDQNGVKSGLNFNAIQSVIVPVPPLNIQKIFKRKIETIRQQKSAMTESLVELENNFNGLMQRAFRGELV